MDVEEWLEGLGLAQYAAAFAENDIDFTILGKLIDADLKELGISSLGHRKRLLAAIAERGVTAAPSPRHADGSPAVDESGIAAHQLADLFGIEGSRYFSESTEISEQYGDLPALPCRRVLCSRPRTDFALRWRLPRSLRTERVRRGSANSTEGF